MIFGSTARAHAVTRVVRSMVSASSTVRAFASWTAVRTPRSLRYGAADDGMQRDRSEVAAVERCRFIPIHEEHLVAGNDAAALPDWEHPSAVVVLACHAHFDAMDRNGWAGAAHGLTWKRENALDK